jgi:hypothetical protein
MGELGIKFQKDFVRLSAAQLPARRWCEEKIVQEQHENSLNHELATSSLLKAGLASTNIAL